MKKLILTMCTGFAVLACSSNNSSTSDDNQGGDQADNQTAQLQRPASQDDFIESYKASLKASASNQNRYFSGMEPEIAIDVVLEDSPVATPDALEADSGGTDRSFSETNTVVEGVGEFDYVNFDGRYIHAIERAQPNLPSDYSYQYALTISDTDQSPISELRSIELGQSHPKGFVLQEQGDELNAVVLSSEYSYQVYRDAAPSRYVGRTEVKVFEDVLSLTSDAPTPQSISIEGDLLTSRVIGDQLVLVTGYMPYIPIISPWLEEQEEDNDAAIDALDDADILPEFTNVAGESAPLVDASNCFVLDETNRSYFGLAQILTITTVDINDLSNVQSTCTTSYASAFYVSQNNLYLTDYGYQSTMIHKFALDDTGAEYRGTGSVPGYIRGGEYSFQFHEKGDSFYALSTLWGETEERRWEPEHTLTVLSESESEAGVLETIGQIPNETRPQAIGKPGEDIFGVRFVEDAAYVVTFERIDPLYVINIEEDTDPRIAGELELPGFSDYLHPLPNGLLLGIGSNGAWPREIIVNLFDVSDEQNPSLITQEQMSEWPGAYQSLAYDHHAFASLNNDSEQTAKASFPFTNIGSVDWFLEDLVAPVNTRALTLLEIDTANRALDTLRVQQIPEASGDYFYQRTILRDEDYFYVSNGLITQGNWDVTAED